MKSGVSNDLNVMIKDLTTLLKNTKISANKIFFQNKIKELTNIKNSPIIPFTSKGNSKINPNHSIMSLSTETDISKTYEHNDSGYTMIKYYDWSENKNQINFSIPLSKNSLTSRYNL